MNTPTNRQELIDLFKKMESGQELQETLALIDSMDDNEIAEACAMCAGFVAAGQLET